MITSSVKPKLVCKRKKVREGTSHNKLVKQKRKSKSQLASRQYTFLHLVSASIIIIVEYIGFAYS